MTSLVLKMKQILKPNVSSGDLPTDNQEGGPSSTSGNGDTVIQISGFQRFLHAKYVNPARAILAEMVGTFILMLCMCGIITSSRLSGDGPVLLEYATTAGLSIVVIIYSIGSISGAHVNPALTIAFAAFGYFPWSRVPFYILAQTLGTILATLMGEFMYAIKSDLLTTQPGPGQTNNAAFMVELIATFIVVFVIAAVNRQSHSVGPVSGLVIGMSIGLAVLIAGPISGGSLNPARSLGPAIVSGNFHRIWIYLTAPVIGAFLGAFMYRLLRLRPIL